MYQILTVSCSVLRSLRALSVIFYSSSQFVLFFFLFLRQSPRVLSIVKCSLNFCNSELKPLSPLKTPFSRLHMILLNVTSLVSFELVISEWHGPSVLLFLILSDPRSLQHLLSCLVSKIYCGLETKIPYKGRWYKEWPDVRIKPQKGG